MKSLRHWLIVWAGTLLALSASAFPTHEVGTTGAAPYHLFTFAAGETFDSSAIESCGTMSFTAGIIAGDTLTVYQLDDPEADASTGTLVVTYSASPTAVTTIHPHRSWIKVDATDTTPGGSWVKMYCSEELTDGGSGGVSATVATLPATGTEGTFYQVTDGVDGTDCTTGGAEPGTDVACIWNGSAYVPAGVAGFITPLEPPDPVVTADEHVIAILTDTPATSLLYGFGSQISPLGEGVGFFDCGVDGVGENENNGKLGLFYNLPSPAVGGGPTNKFEHAFFERYETSYCDGPNGEGGSPGATGDEVWVERNAMIFYPDFTTTLTAPFTPSEAAFELAVMTALSSVDLFDGQIEFGSPTGSNAKAIVRGYNPSTNVLTFRMDKGKTAPVSGDVIAMPGGATATTGTLTSSYLAHRWAQQEWKLLNETTTLSYQFAAEGDDAPATLRISEDGGVAVNWAGSVSPGFQAEAQGYTGQAAAQFRWSSTDVTGKELSQTVCVDEADGTGAVITSANEIMIYTTGGSASGTAKGTAAITFSDTDGTTSCTTTTNHRLTYLKNRPWGVGAAVIVGDDLSIGGEEYTVTQIMTAPNWAPIATSTAMDYSGSDYRYNGGATQLFVTPNYGGDGEDFEDNGNSMFNWAGVALIQNQDFPVASGRSSVFTVGVQGCDDTIAPNTFDLNEPGTGDDEYPWACSDHGNFNLSGGGFADGHWTAGSIAAANHSHLWKQKYGICQGGGAAAQAACDADGDCDGGTCNLGNKLWRTKNQTSPSTNPQNPFDGNFFVQGPTGIAALTDDGPILGAGGGGIKPVSEAAFKTAVNLEIGTDVQAYDADLSTIAALTPSAGAVMFGNGSAWVADTTPAIDISDVTGNLPEAALPTTSRGIQTATSDPIDGTTACPNGVGDIWIRTDAGNEKLFVCITASPSDWFGVALTDAP